MVSDVGLVKPLSGPHHPLLNVAELMLTLSTLISTTVDILLFYWNLYNQLLKVKCAFNFEKTIIRWDLYFTNTTIFQSLEVVDRGSETQL